MIGPAMGAAATVAAPTAAPRGTLREASVVPANAARPSRHIRRIVLAISSLNSKKGSSFHDHEEFAAARRSKVSVIMGVDA
jgi:hypothetical protein